jgi:hypothetical protein
LQVLRKAVGVILHSSYAKKLVSQFYPAAAESIELDVLPLVRALPLDQTRADARRKLGLPATAFVACSFGIVATIKLADRVLGCWMQSALRNDPDSHLFFVGYDLGSYGTQLTDLITENNLEGQVHFTGFCPPDIYRAYLDAADIAIQVRTLTRGETSAAALDCMAHGLPTVVNAHGSLAELPSDAVLRLPDQFSNAELLGAMEELQRDAARRAALSERARFYAATHLSPWHSASEYHASIERFYATGRQALISKTLLQLQRDIGPDRQEEDLLPAIRTLSRNIPVPPAQRRLLVDVSALCEPNGKPGAERTLRAILHGLLASPPGEFRAEPIHASSNGRGYQYARRFTLRFLDVPDDALDDGPLEFMARDIFLGLVLEPGVVSTQAELFSQARDLGVTLYFVLTDDLLETTFREALTDRFTDADDRWLTTIVTYADGVLVPSQTLADQLLVSIEDKNIRRMRCLKIGYCDLSPDGNDLETIETQAANASRLIDAIVKPDWYKTWKS